jgi:hypothetical protein
MKRLITILTVCSLLACSKGKDTELVTIHDIVGKWKLVEYYRDIGNGMGEWVPTDPNDIEIVQFDADGKFLHNENFSIQDGINRYRIIGKNKIELYSSVGTDTVQYFFKQDSKNELIFNPVCREFSCMKKHVRLQ